jgi:hypothetical protein
LPGSISSALSRASEAALESRGRFLVISRPVQFVRRRGQRGSLGVRPGRPLFDTLFDQCELDIEQFLQHRLGLLAQFCHLCIGPW